MTLSLKHKFASLIPDAGDPTIVQPSNWNDEHALTQATSTILGRVSALTGATEELTPAQARTLLNVGDGATANSPDAFLLARANHTGTESADVLTDGTTNKAFLATERTKLAGIATGATANSTDAFLLARANHTGTQLAATISDFSTAADLRIAAAAATGTGSLVRANNATVSGTFTLGQDPATALEAATKQYVDNLAAGLDVKPSARAATTANITLSAPQTIDGVSVIAGDRVLVKDQTTPAQNGIYVVAAGAWTRATDMDAWTEVPGANVWVEEGTTNADRAWVCTANAGGTIGTTAITWSQFGGTGAFQAASANLTSWAAITRAAGFDAWVAGGTSAQLAAILTDETGTGKVVFSDSAALTGTPSAPTAAVDTNTTQLATTAMVLAQAAAATPLGNLATAAVGTSTRFARADHVHPGRENLTADRTYYVRIDGSDSNTGLVNSAGGAFLTIQKAVNIATQTIDCRGFNIVIQVVDSTAYTSGFLMPAPVLNGTLTVRGNTTTPANVTITTTTANIFDARGGAVVSVEGFKTVSSSGGSHVVATEGGIIYYKTMDFGAATGGNHAIAFNEGNIFITGNYTISGAAAVHWHSTDKAEIRVMSAITVTITGTPAFSSFFAGCKWALLHCYSVTFSGAATGKRFYVHSDGVIDCGVSGSLTYLPGSTAGEIADNGGVYNTYKRQKNPNDVTASRAAATSYQNTQLCDVLWNVTVASTDTVRTDWFLQWSSDNASFFNAGIISTAYIGYNSTSIMVPRDYYYKLVKVGGGVNNTINVWTEWY